MGNPQGTNGDPAGGLRVDSAALRESSQAACQVSQELLAVRSAWDRTTAEPGDAFGYRDVLGNFQLMQEAWFAELGVYADVLQQMCAGIEASADAYADSDSDSAARLASHRQEPR